MNSIDIIILAVALSIDACVVSFSNGLVFTVNKRKNSLMLATSVGFFQFLMPILGWLMAKGVYKFVEPFAPWIVFAIFTFLGSKFILDAFKSDKPEKISCYLCFSYILAVSVATSIDAMAAGVSIYFAGTRILFPAVVIGIVTFINSLIGFWGGHLFKRFPTKYLEIFAGLILIFLAIKVLIENF